MHREIDEKWVPSDVQTEDDYGGVKHLGLSEQLKIANETIKELEKELAGKEAEYKIQMEAGFEEAYQEILKVRKDLENNQKEHEKQLMELRKEFNEILKNA